MKIPEAEACVFCGTKMILEDYSDDLWYCPEGCVGVMDETE